VRVKGPLFCFCGHTFKAHAWFEKSTRCRCPDCKCGKYNYLHRQGSWFLVCQCKHAALEHHRQGQASACQHAGCPCAGFRTNMSCVCGESWAEHETVAETEAERREQGRPVDSEVSALHGDWEHTLCIAWAGQLSGGRCLLAFQVVQKRLADKKKEKPAEGTCGRCIGCKCKMKCRAGYTYGRREPL
jgi:hypothetical protein